MEQDASSGGLFGLIIPLAFVVLMIVSMWKVFEKAGEPGWKALIPFLNVYTLITIAGKPGWWLVLFFIPIVNFVILILVSISLAQAFGKGSGFGLGLLFLGFIFYPILAFGETQYKKPARAAE